MDVQGWSHLQRSDVSWVPAGKGLEMTAGCCRQVCDPRVGHWALPSPAPGKLFMRLLRTFCGVAVSKLSQFLTVQSDLDKGISVWMLELLEALGWLRSC